MELVRFFLTSRGLLKMRFYTSSLETAKKYSSSLSFIALLFLVSCGSAVKRASVPHGDYPQGAEVVQLKQIGNDTDSLKLIAEIDIFKGSKIPIGEIVDMEEIGDRLYFADSKQNIVHVIDKESLKYKTSIGGSGPDQLFRVFSLDVGKDNNLIVGDSQGPDLLKIFNINGTFLKAYPNNNPPLWFISTNINGSFVKDSLAYVSKLFADEGNKVIRYNLRGGEANKVNEIVPVTDLHAEVDSATKSKIIPRLYVLKSEMVDTLFYVLPSNKYLINSYNMKGEKLKSIDLRGIPQIDKAYSIMKRLPGNSFFHSAIIDSKDNIYFHFPRFEGVELDDSGEVLLSKLVGNASGTSLLAIDLADGTYQVFKTESRSVAPLKMVGDKLWCFDIMNTQILVYQM